MKGRSDTERVNNILLQKSFLNETLKRSLLLDDRKNDVNENNRQANGVSINEETDIEYQQT